MTVIISPSLAAIPGRLLAAVLQGVETEIREVGDRLARRVDAEDAARFAYSFVHGRHYPMPGPSTLASSERFRRLREEIQAENNGADDADEDATSGDIAAVLGAVGIVDLAPRDTPEDQGHHRPVATDRERGDHERRDRESVHRPL